MPNFLIHLYILKKKKKKALPIQPKKESAERFRRLAIP